MGAGASHPLHLDGPEAMTFLLYLGHVADPMANSFQRPLFLVLWQGAPQGRDWALGDMSGLTLRRNFRVNVKLLCNSSGRAGCPSGDLYFVPGSAEGLE